MQQKQRYVFGDPNSGQLNADDADFSILPNQWQNMENCRTGSTDAGVINTVESIGSTILKSSPQPSVVFMELGSAEDEENGLFCTFYYNTNGPWHKIECYIAAVDTIYTVLLSSQITGGLNFSKNFPIHSARIVNGYLYWPEGTNNQPRKINIFAGIKMNHPSFVTDVVPYVAPLSPFEITIIKPPPSLAPNISKAIDAGFNNNFIANDSFEFAFQYIFYDNETTVIGSYSPASRLNSATDTSNYIAVVMDSLQQIPGTVRFVNLIVRFSNTNFANIIKTWDKEITADNTEITNQNNNSTLLTFNFYNNVTGEAIANGIGPNGEAQGVNLVLKAADSVPLFSDTLEAARNRLYLGNNIAGYDTPGTTSLSLSLSTTNPFAAASIVKNLTEVRASVNKPGPSNDFAYGGWYVYLSATDGVTAGYYLLNGTEKSSTSPTAITFWYLLPPLDPPATTATLLTLTYIGATQSDVINYILYTFGGDPGDTLENNAFYSRSNTLTISGISSSIYSIFKTRLSYRAGVVFYDFAMRKCGVVTNDGLIFEIPSRNYNFTSAINGVIWTLSNATALTEIPDWAYYYSVVRTLNQRTRFFIQFFDNAPKYATKDATGNYLFTSSIYINAAVGIGINTTAMVQAGLGYVFTEGDICVLVDDTNNIYELPVIGQQGNYIIVKAKDIGTLTLRKFIAEIYTPYQASLQEPFFEIGQVYRVLDPGTTARRYEITSDVLIPDAYALTRNFSTFTYFAETMSPNDLFFQRWDNDGGKPNFITKLGQAIKETYFSFSNTFIPNTAINGLSTFDALDEISVPQDSGSITKIILTSKVQGEGTIMLVICTSETNSVYLGETQIADSTGAIKFFSSTSGVVGTINTLRGSYGCLDANAVIAFRGFVLWWDGINGKIIQYASNGLFPISNYKMTTFWKQYSEKFLSMTATEIESFGGRPFVFASVDPAHNELLFSIPKLVNVPPKGYLPDYSILPPVSKTCYDIRVSYKAALDVKSYYGIFVYLTASETLPEGYYLIPSTQVINNSLTPPPATIPPATIDYSQLIFKGSTPENVYINLIPNGYLLETNSIALNGHNTTVSGIKIQTIYPFDILDFQGKAIVYELKLGEGNPKWKGSYSFIKNEGFTTLQNKLYSYSNGLLYEHNSIASFNNFYGIQYRSRIMFVSNQFPDIPKVYNAISVQANMKPLFIYLYNSYPYQQCSDLVDNDFRDLEGLFYAVILRNKLIPTETGYTTDGLLTGEKMRNTAMKIMLEFLSDTTQLELKFVDISFTISKGHRPANG